MLSSNTVVNNTQSLEECLKIRERNRQKQLERRKAQYLINKENILALNKKYQDVNREVLNAKNLERYRRYQAIRKSMSTLSHLQL